MTICSSEAVVLRHLDYGEADRIVTFFSREYGLLRGFARQARKSRRRFGAALEPYARITLRWQHRRSGDLVFLQESELLDLRSGLRHHIEALALAAYGCELVEGLLGETQAQPDVYGLLSAFLDHLGRHGGSLAARLLYELRLLSLAGYEPHLLHCACCGAALPAAQVAFSAARGGSLCLACADATAGPRLSLPSLGSLARILRAPPTLFEGVRLSVQTLREGGALTRSALQQHLCRPPRSLAFLEQVLPPDDRHAAGFSQAQRRVFPRQTG
jgi:DNA repair protein RecO (recombination protein O)